MRCDLAVPDAAVGQLHEVSAEEAGVEGAGGILFAIGVDGDLKKGLFFGVAPGEVHGKVHVGAASPCHLCEGAVVQVYRVGREMHLNTAVYERVPKLVAHTSEEDAVCGEHDADARKQSTREGYHVSDARMQERLSPP